MRWVATSLLVLVAAACNPPGPRTRPARGPEVRIVAIDVGQGDGVLVIGTDGTTVLIDGGGLNKGGVVAAAVDEETSGRVDHVIVTHYDADHLAGLADFMLGADRQPGTADDGAPGADVWDYGDDGSCSSLTCIRWRQVRAGRGQVATVGQRFALGDATLTVVAVNGDVAGGTHVTVDDENSRCVSVLIEHGAFRAFLGGDLTGGGAGTPDVETPVSRATGRVDLLKVDHHGSDTSTAQAALAQWAPRGVIISVGTDNSYCHPTSDVLHRLSQTGAAVFATGQGVVTPGHCVTTTWPDGSTRGGTLRVNAFADGRFDIDGIDVP